MTDVHIVIAVLALALNAIAAVPLPEAGGPKNTKLW